MTLPLALRAMGVLLGVIAAGSAALGFAAACQTAAAFGGGPDGGLMGVGTLLLSGALLSIWQTVAGTAMSLLCFAAARLLDGQR